MPDAPKKPCAYPGCSRLTDAGRCDLHPRAPDARGTRTKKYDRRAWRDGLRVQKLRANPLCENCEAEGRAVVARHVDHKDGDSDNDAWANLQSLCPPCHSRKTATHDGGFGNAPRR